MKRIVLIVIVSLSLFACKKESQSFVNREATGVLLHNISLQPLPGQQIQLEVVEQWVDADRKDAEFPNGYPMFSVVNYNTTTDAQGKYSFNFTTSHQWSYRVIVNNPVYVRKFRGLWGVITLNPNAIKVYDTVYAEKPGYIRYFVQNTGVTSSSDSLYLRTAGDFSTKFVPLTPVTGFVFLPRDGYNFWWAGASVNTIVYDTMAAESVHKFQARWLHMRNDTITYRADSISVSPHTVTDYHINY